MLGSTKEGICIKCETRWQFHYGITSIYEDKQGKFLYKELNCCQKCGHIVNSERLKDAKQIGTICF